MTPSSPTASPTGRTPASRPGPFSDAQRDEAAALGIIAGGGSGFRDTLRQFRVPRHRSEQSRHQALVAPATATPKSNDTLMPVAQRHAEPEAEQPAHPLRRHASLLLSLAGGFAVGALVARGVVDTQRESTSAASLPTSLPSSPAASVPSSLPTSAVLPAIGLAGSPAPSAASLAPSVAHVNGHPPAGGAQIASALPPTPACPNSTTAPVAPAAASKAVSAELERSWLLDRARLHQRAYRLTDAERFYRKVLAQAPRDSEALAGLGELELLRGTVQAADQRFQEALQANSSYVPALVAVADIRWQTGRGEEARTAYRDIVEQHSAGTYPPYVAQRSASAVFPDCDR